MAKRIENRRVDLARKRGQMRIIIKVMVLLKIILLVQMKKTKITYNIDLIKLYTLIAMMKCFAKMK